MKKSLLKNTLYINKSALAKTALLLGLVLTTSFGPVSAFANTIFEGYYKVLLSNVHAGYAVQRYEFDPAKKEFVSTYYVYVRTSPDGKRFTSESLTARSNEKFHPLGYQYTAIVDGKPIAIDTKAAGGKLTGTMQRDGKKTPITTVVPEGAFLSTMLLHLVLQNGLKVGKAFSYKAVAEEDAKVLDGTLKVASEQKYKTVNAFKLEYEFKDIKSEALISEEGHVLYSNAPAQGVATELVDTPSLAKGSFPFPEKTLKTLFGNIPAGAQNTLAKLKSSAVKPTSPTDTLKTGGSGGTGN